MPEFTRRRFRRAPGAAALIVAMSGPAGLAGCAQEESAGPETGPVTLENIQDLREDIDVLDDRVRTLEAQATIGPAQNPTPIADDPVIFFEDPDSVVGEEVTVSGEVTSLFAGLAEGRSAFLIGADGGEPVAVLSAESPPGGLAEGDVVRVSGTVVRVAPDSFEDDFGEPLEEFFNDPDPFLTDIDGEPALAADSVEVIDERAEE